LAHLFPLHVCAIWLGHTERIADQFHRRVTGEHFYRGARLLAGGAKSSAPAAQKAASSGTETQRLLQALGTGGPVPQNVCLNSFF
jgi:hypothetical protein